MQIPIIREDIKDLTIECITTLPSIPPSLFCRKKMSINSCRAEARERARASPPCFRGPIKAREKTIFAIIATTATFTGVLVSCNE